MTQDLAAALDEYRQGLEAEIQRLEALATIAASQGQAVVHGDAAHAEALASTRAEVFRELTELEARNRPLRQQLAVHLPLARELRGFDEVCALHRRAEREIDCVLSHDRDTRARLEEDAGPRRVAAHELETGEATLAAYRKVLSPAAPRSGIVDRRG